MVPDEFKNVSEVGVLNSTKFHRLSFVLDLGKSASERVMFLARLKPLLMMVNDG